VLGNGSLSEDPEISKLQDLYNTLVQDIQAAQPEGSNGQEPPSLHDYLVAMQQNLADSHQPLAATGNVLNVEA
jgi:hypothetical protein